MLDNRLEGSSEVEIRTFSIHEVYREHASKTHHPPTIQNGDRSVFRLKRPRRRQTNNAHDIASTTTSAVRFTIRRTVAVGVSI
jgi:hypothetical protein